MPNIITHTLFAQEIFDKVDENTHALFEPRLHLLEIGSNGPDFLFFHGMNPKDFFKKSDLRVSGSMFHAGHVNEFYQKALISIRNETDEEIKKETTNYYNEYYKVNQIVLGIVDTSTLESLSETVVNQKKALIEAILKEAKSGVDFEELVKKYSEEASSDNNLYFTKDGVLEEVYNAVDSLKEEEISDIIKTKYAYSIIKRLPLDDKKLNDYLEKKAKEKYNNDITTKAEDYKVFYENAYKKIK